MSRPKSMTPARPTTGKARGPRTWADLPASDRRIVLDNIAFDLEEVLHSAGQCDSYHDEWKYRARAYRLAIRALRLAARHPKPSAGRRGKGA